MKLLNKNKLLKSKSGLSFFMLLPMAAMLLLGLFLFVVSEPNKEAIYDKTFETTTSVDILASESLINSFYVNSLVKNSLGSYKEKYFEEFEASSRLKEVDVDESKFRSCSFKDNLILYNEAYLDFQNLVKEHDSNNNLTLFSCFPQSSGNFSDELSLFIDENLNGKLEGYFSEGSGELINLDVNNNLNSYSVDVGYKLISSIGKSGGVSFLDNVKVDYSFGNFINLISTLEIILPDLSSLVKSDIILCKKNLNESILDKDLECIKNSFNDLFKNEDSILYSKLKFNISWVENPNELGFYGLSINVFDLSLGKEIFDFMVVLENNLPIGQVDYSLKVSEKYNNVIDLDIVKPNLKNNSLQGFVILYSYENFLNKNSYSEYGELINLLENSQIPEGFGKMYANINYGGINSQNKGSISGSGMDLTLSYITGFASNDEIIKTSVHQMYNEDTSEFELLQPGRKVYFAVFAVDSKFNYFTDEELLNEVFKDVTPKNILGPVPLKKEQVKLNGNIENFDESIEFEINNYLDLSLDTFELYVVSGKESNFNEVCITNPNTDCQKFIFSYDNLVSGKYLISSNTDGLDTSSYLNVFKTNFDLGDGSNIRFYLVPVNSEGIGHYSKILAMKSLDKVHHYYDYLGASSEKNVFYFETKITDRRAPLLTDVQITGLKKSGNGVSVQWGIRQGSDVDKLIVKLFYLDGSGVESFQIKTISSQNLIELSPSLNSLELRYAVPVDKSRNSLYTTQNIQDSQRISHFVTG